MADDGDGGLGPEEILRNGLESLDLDEFLNFTDDNLESLNSFLNDFSIFVQNPLRYLVTLTIGGLLYLSNAFSDIISGVIGLFDAPPEYVGDLVISFAKVPADAALATVQRFNELAINAAYQTGPLAPVVVFIIWMLEVAAFLLVISLVAPYIGGALWTAIGVIRR